MKGHTVIVVAMTNTATINTRERLAELPTDMLERFRGRAAELDRTNTYFHDDLAELRSVGYLAAVVPAIGCAALSMRLQHVRSSRGGGRWALVHVAESPDRRPRDRVESRQRRMPQPARPASRELRAPRPRNEAQVASSMVRLAYASVLR